MTSSAPDPVPFRLLTEDEEVSFEDVVESADEHEMRQYVPIHLNNKICNDRFLVTHKLGQGAYGAVWLCQDLQPKDGRQWVAVKVLTATHTPKDDMDCPDLFVRDKLQQTGVDVAGAFSKGIVLPLEHFRLTRTKTGIEHLCLVLPVLGQDLQEAAEACKYDQLALTNVCYQMLQILSHLKNHSICHADFRPANILFKIDDTINNFTQSEMLAHVGGAPKIILNRKTEKFPDTPKYFVVPTSVPSAELDKIAVIDFGLAFHTDDAEARTPGIPSEYSAPEGLLGGKVGYSNDLWSLACSILTVRIGTGLFGLDPVHVLLNIENLNGKVPDFYEEAYNKEFRKSAGIEDDEVLSDGDSEEEYPESEAEEDARVLRERGTGTNLRAKLRQERYYEIDYDECKHGDTSPVYTRAVKKKQIAYKIPAEEVDQLLDLLQKMTKWKVNERLTIAQARDHPWFNILFSHRSVKKLEFKTVNDLRLFLDGPTPDEIGLSSITHSRSYRLSTMSDEQFAGWIDEEFALRKSLIQQSLVFSYFWREYVADCLHDASEDAPQLRWKEDVWPCCRVIATQLSQAIRPQEKFEIIQSKPGLTYLEYVARFVMNIGRMYAMRNPKGVNISQFYSGYGKGKNLGIENALAGIFSALEYKERLYRQLGG